MIQSSPSVISLLVCIGIEILLGFLFLVFWNKRKKDTEQLVLSLWFFTASMYHFFRLRQFFAPNDLHIEFISKASGLSHFMLIYLGWWFICFYIKRKPEIKQILWWTAICAALILLFLFSEGYITKQILIRETVFGEKFYSLRSGSWYPLLGWTRPLLLLYLTILLIRSEIPDLRERKYIIIAFSMATVFSISDMFSILLNLKWIRAYDFAYLPLGALFLIILVDRYFLLLNQLEILVDKRTNELTEANRELRSEIEVRTKTEQELNLYKKDLEKVVEKRTLELNKVIHEYQALNEELTATNEILEDQRNQLQTALQKLEIASAQIIQSEKMAALGVLTAGIAHEINNPLNFVVAGIANLEHSLKELKNYIGISSEQIMLVKQNTGYDIEAELKDIRDLISYIKTGAERITEIIRSLSIFNRYDEEKIEKTNIHDILDSALIILRYELRDRIKITKQYSKIPVITCSSGKLNQVFINLLSNAIHAIPGQGEIVIKTFFDEISKHIVISIRDSGSGIDKKIQNKIFEPFFTTKEVGLGTGLGLSIVYNIVQQMKGEIRFVSEPGEGTEFIVSLPKSIYD